MSFCTQCGTHVPHAVATTESYLVPAGILDSNLDGRPEYNIFWASRAPWCVEPQELPKFDEYGG
ncbi:MAG: GFA family protein [Burkholderiales bacterium]|nr:GFA family protein [Burkholderiales bacterium]